MSGSTALLTNLLKSYSERIDQVIEFQKALAPLGTTAATLVEMNAKLDELVQSQRDTNRRIEIMAGELVALTAEVGRTRTVVDSTKALVAGLRQQIIDAGTDPVALKALTDSLAADNDELAALTTAVVTPPVIGTV